MATRWPDLLSQPAHTASMQLSSSLTSQQQQQQSHNYSSSSIMPFAFAQRRPSFLISSSPPISPTFGSFFAEQQLTDLPKQRTRSGSIGFLARSAFWSDTPHAATVPRRSAFHGVGAYPQLGLGRLPSSFYMPSDTESSYSYGPTYDTFSRRNSTSLLNYTLASPDSPPSGVTSSYMQRSPARQMSSRLSVSPRRVRPDYSAMDMIPESLDRAPSHNPQRRMSLPDSDVRSTPIIAHRRPTLPPLSSLFPDLAGRGPSSAPLLSDSPARSAAAWSPTMPMQHNDSPSSDKSPEVLSAGSTSLDAPSKAVRPTVQGHRTASLPTPRGFSGSFSASVQPEHFYSQHAGPAAAAASDSTAAARMSQAGLEKPQHLSDQTQGAHVESKSQTEALERRPGPLFTPDLPKGQRLDTFKASQASSRLPSRASQTSFSCSLRLPASGATQASGLSRSAEDIDSDYSSELSDCAESFEEVSSLDKGRRVKASRRQVPRTSSEEGSTQDSHLTEEEMVSKHGKPLTRRSKVIITDTDRRRPGYVRPIEEDRKKVRTLLDALLRAAPGNGKHLNCRFPYEPSTRFANLTKMGLKMIWSPRASFAESELASSTRRFRKEQCERLIETIQSGHVSFVSLDGSDSTASSAAPSAQPTPTQPVASTSSSTTSGKRSRSHSEAEEEDDQGYSKRPRSS